MRFEEALAFEIELIPALANKVFPLVVSADKTAPYVAYVSNEGVKLKTLTGYINSKSISAEVSIVAKTYPEMKQLTSLVTESIISFQTRAIGDGTLYVQDVILSEPQEGYDVEPDLYRSTIPFQVYL
ncbi:DUF3168 domain-containing protein [Paenibacillus sp. GCM10023248]|uniref:DUF3168 domain-containing protein n=1 Tax=unclassified Paenibacillus TaxID=185978 RepID=UPI002379ECF8|nr:DUF3168 domain-containing protein [Paenibacillus sp. MAHUQ-63]MDD9266053.1 DUF3168 domain-containing protein [Paenibacillus sp. MAHUQ-63]